MRLHLRLALNKPALLFKKPLRFKGFGTMRLTISPTDENKFYRLTTSMNFRRG